MKAGGTYTYYVARQTASGTPAYGRGSSDFVVSLNGAPITYTGFAEIGTPAGSAWDIYTFTIQDPAAVGFREYLIEVANNQNNTDIIMGGYISGAMQANDEDSLAGLLLLMQGVPAVQSANSSQLGDWVDGDAYTTPILQMPAGKLSQVGISSLAGLTVEAGAMLAPNTTSVPIPTVTVIDPINFYFTFGWSTTSNPFTALGALTQQTWSIDVHVIQTGPPKLIVTTNRYTLNQVWKRDTRTS